MILNLGLSLMLFWGLTLGLGWPIARRFPLEPVEKVGATVVLSLLLIFLVGWTVYIWELPLFLFWSLPAAASIALICEWRAIIATIRDPDTRTLINSQLLISAWSVGLLALIVSYSGGAWVADWWGHLQRTWFFLDRGPHDIVFNGFDPLTSRPPLANVIDGVLVQITHRDFVHYQFFSTLLASLVFFPAGLLARRFGDKRAVPILALLFMINPMFAQNATFAWTKLPAAFFTLTSLYFFLRAQDQPANCVHAVLFATALAAGLLTHYSTGPYAVIFGVSWICLGWPHRHERRWLRNTGLAALAGTMVLATWFGWSFSIEGIRGTLLTNTSITEKAADSMAQLQVVTLNIRDTLSPHFLRDLNTQLVEQQSSLGRVRDWFFQIYQINFFFAFGSLAWLAIAIRLIKQRHCAPTTRAYFWMAFIIGNTLLGIAVHGSRDPWGLAHICLQPLVMLGLAFLASQWSLLPSYGRSILIAGGTLDFIAGIGLQFTVQSFAFERWLSPARSIFEIISDYSRPTAMNFYAKMHNHWAFLGDVLIDYGYAIVGFLTVVFLVAVRFATSTKRTGVASPGV